MRRSVASLFGMFTVAALLLGCQTMTGRTAGQYVDDQTTTAKVKTALAGVEAGTITRVGVDTVNGTVHLTGVVRDPAVKGEILQAAHRAADGKPIVDNMTFSTTPAALPRATTTSTSPAVNRLVSDLRFSRLEPEMGSGRYVAFDSAGRRVATVVDVPAKQMEEQGMPHVDTAGRPINHVSIYPNSGADGSRYHVVLWHISRDEATRLQ